TSGVEHSPSAALSREADDEAPARSVGGDAATVALRSQIRVVHRLADACRRPLVLLPERADEIDIPLHSGKPHGDERPAARDVVRNQLTQELALRNEVARVA